MAIFVPSPAGFAWIWPYSSDPRRVLREYGHIHPILDGFYVKMAISVQSSAGFAWKWPYLSDPRRVLGAFIQILRVSRREWIDHKGMQPQTYRVFDSMDKWESIFWSVRVGAYCIRPKMYKEDESFAHCHGNLWGVCNTPLHRYTKNGSLGVGGFNGESIFWSVSVGAYCIRPSVYRADDSMDKRESNFWSVRVGEYCIRPTMYKEDESFAHCHGYLWGVCHTPLRRYMKNGSLRVGGFNGESIFWSIRVGAYCIRPKTYRVFDSMDKRKSNFWSVRVGAYCIRPKTYRVDNSMIDRESNSWQEKDSINTNLIDTYRAGDSFAHYHGYLWGVCNTPLHRYTKNGAFRVGDFNGESIFWSVRVGAYCIRPCTYRADDSIDRWE